MSEEPQKTRDNIAGSIRDEIAHLKTDIQTLKDNAIIRAESAERIQSLVQLAAGALAGGMTDNKSVCGVAVRVYDALTKGACVRDRFKGEPFRIRVEIPRLGDAYRLNMNRCLLRVTVIGVFREEDGDLYVECMGHQNIIVVPLEFFNKHAIKQKTRDDARTFSTRREL